jgi:hypothetical protein
MKMTIEPKALENLIGFTDEELEKILSLQKQEGFETVQETVICAVNTCLKE